MWPQSRVIQVGYHSRPQRQFTQTWRNMTRLSQAMVELRNGEAASNFQSTICLIADKLQLDAMLNWLLRYTTLFLYHLIIVILVYHVVSHFFFQV